MPLLTADPQAQPAHGRPCPRCGSRLRLAEPQRAMLWRIAMGETLKAIRTRYGCGKDKAASALGEVIQTLGATGRAQAVDIACRAGLLPFPDTTQKKQLLVRPSQMRVAIRLAAGDSYAKIAADLDCSPDTVKSHLHALYKALEAVSAPHAVYSLHARGMLHTHHPCPCPTPPSPRAVGR
ncbi:LuxR C-terminal-related transcriptional regulator [Kitasatospora sp. NPDC057936]|uniref:helix-turn-helix transcriptional regulator n=1 Tax=Kitasatospora sp. NPDC057936 TaxID=3346283 RepID=UPI0036D76696